MKLFHSLALAAAFAACLYSTGCVASSNNLEPTAGSRRAAVVAATDQEAVEAFTRKAELIFPKYDNTMDDKERTLVSHRILDGFEAAPSRLVMVDGTSIHWGFKYQEANVQSVIISDPSGAPVLLAAVNGVNRLTNRSRPPIKDMARYRQALRRSGMEPSVTIFVHGEEAIHTYLPLLKRWLQADLMGFNVDCSDPDLMEACKLAEQIPISTTVYVIAADGSLRSINAPDVQAAAVPLKSFVQ